MRRVSLKSRESNRGKCSRKQGEIRVTSEAPSEGVEGAEPCLTIAEVFVSSTTEAMSGDINNNNSIKDESKGRDCMVSE